MSMWNLPKFRSWSSWTAMLVLVLQPCHALAVTNARTSVATAFPTNRVADIALKQGGVLQGQIINAAGVGVAKATLELTNGRQHWQAKTDGQGWFQFANLRGGTYHMQAGGQSQILRAWAPGTAPPTASLGLLVSPSTDVVRGQNPVSPNTNQFFCVAKKRLANPWVVGGIAATAVSIPVLINNIDDDDTPPATP